MRSLDPATNLLKPDEPTENEMSTLTAMVQKYIRYMKHIERTIDHATKIQKKMNELRLDKIPSFALDVAQQSEFTIKTGERVTIEDELKASIAKKNAPIAHAFIKTAGSGSIIKKTIKIEFDRSPEGETESKGIIEKLEDLEAVFEVAEGVHKSKLENFVTTEKKKNTDFEHSGINVFELKVCRIEGMKPPKFKP